jgi:hypothetical protein
MKIKKLKSVIAELPKTSGLVKKLLNNPRRFDIAPPVEMSAQEFIRDWDSAEECLHYISNCTSEDLLSLSDLFTLMSDGTPIENCIINAITPDQSVEQLEVWYSDVVITFPHNDTIMEFIHNYMIGKVKPVFTLKKLVKSLTK